MAHKWVDWLHKPCHLEGPQCFEEGDTISSGPPVRRSATLPLLSRGISDTPERGTKTTMAHKWADWLHHPGRSGWGPERFRVGDKISAGPQVGG